ncbi:MAG: hypothetical protein IKW01_01405 [Firmicutes bacterium]|nr:hypothetical protein [Bacillota bacterium]
MDRNYYYRVLGLRPGATNEAIKKAYNSRMARLASPDYADDPEYVAKKAAQAKHAYAVLMGNAAPLTKMQHKSVYECYKDDIEDNRDSDHFKKGHKIVANVENIIKNSMLSKKLAGIIAVLIIAVIPVSIAAVGSLVGSIFDYVSPDYPASTQSEQEEYVQDNIDAVRRVMARDMEYDFWGSLMYPAEDIDAENIEWDLSSGTENQLWDLNRELAFAMDIESVPDMIGYLTGNDDAYFEFNDYTISEYMVGLMGAPAFSDIAGMGNTYTGEVILNYADYMNFLIMTAEIQTDEICSIPAVDYYD